jgi:hypothetical protein
LLLACPPRRPKRWTDADIDPTIENGIEQLLERLYALQPAIDADGNPFPVVVHLTSEAQAAWKAYYNAHAQEHVELFGELSAAWSKLEECAARFALVIHCVRSVTGDPALDSEGVVDLRSMRAGVRLTEWFKRETRRVYALLGESDDERDDRRLVEFVERKGGSVTCREVRQGCRWLREPGIAEAALNALVKARRGVWELSPAGRPGQPTRRFRLSVVNVNGNAETSEVHVDTVDVDTVDDLNIEGNEWGEI